MNRRRFLSFVGVASVAAVVAPTDVPQQTIPFTSPPVRYYKIDATGADVAAISRLSVALASVNRSIESRAVAALSAHRMMRA